MCLGQCNGHGIVQAFAPCKVLVKWALLECLFTHIMVQSDGHGLAFDMKGKPLSSEQAACFKFSEQPDLR